MARILLAEDKDDMAQLMAEIMRSEDHDVTIAQDGDKAIEALKNDGNFDLVVTDVIMPVKDGIDVVNHLKTMDKKIPTIVISGGGITVSSDSALKAIEHEVDMVLKKPINIKTLVDSINTLLSGGTAES